MDGSVRSHRRTLLLVLALFITGSIIVGVLSSGRATLTPLAVPDPKETPWYTPAVGSIPLPLPPADAHPISCEEVAVSWGECDYAYRTRFSRSALNVYYDQFFAGDRWGGGRESGGCGGTFVYVYEYQQQVELGTKHHFLAVHRFVVEQDESGHIVIIDVRTPVDYEGMPSLPSC